MNARFGILVMAASVCLAGEPGILCVRGSTVLSLDHRGKIVRTVRVPFEPEWASGASDGSILYSAGKCSPSASLTFASIDRPGKSIRALAPPLRGEGEIRMEVWTPMLSPDGRTIAAVDAPCPGGGEVIENGGLVITISPASGEAKVLFASRDQDGTPIGMAVHPMWSADGQRILVSYETGFRIYDAEFGLAVNHGDHPGLIRGWSTAIGWMGSNCIVLREGDDYVSGYRRPPVVLNLTNDKLASLEEVTGIRHNLADVEMVHDTLALRTRSIDWQVISLVDGRKIADHKSTKAKFAGFVPAEEPRNRWEPAFCAAGPPRPKPTH